MHFLIVGGAGCIGSHMVKLLILRGHNVTVFVNTLNLLDTMVSANVRRLVFSSTAAVFGEPLYIPIDEKHVKAPINPYGRTKWAVEQTLQDYGVAYGLSSVCLRYFNAAGADPEEKDTIRKYI